MVCKPSQVRYNLEGGVDGPSDKVYSHLSQVPLTPAPTRVGYTFQGWATSAGGSVTYNTSTTKFVMPNTAVNLYAVWTANTNTKYTVEHYQMNTSGAYPSTATETQSLTGTSDSSLTLANLKKTYTGLTYSYGQVNSSNATTTTIAPDGTRVIKLYYERNKYKFTLGTGSNLSTAGSTGTSDIYYGATVTLKAVANTGYTWQQWTSSNTGLVGNTTSANTTFTMPLGEITMTPSVLVNSYTISYTLNGGTAAANAPTTANYDSLFTVNNPTKTGYTFAGWDITGMDSVTHTYGSSTTTATSISKTKETSFKNLRSTSGTVTFVANWTANTYSISYALNSGTNGANAPTTATFDTAFTLSNPTRTGYAFAGWDITGMDSVTHTIGSTTSQATSLTGRKETSFKNLRATSGTVTFTAKWTASQVTYKVEHYQMNTSGTYPTTANATQNLTGASDSTLTLANLKQTYTGLTYSYGQVGGSTVTTTTVAPDSSRVIKLYYTRNKYRFTLGTGSNVSTTGSTGTSDVYYGATVTLKATANTGYTFKQWTSSNTSLVATTTTANTSFTMPLGAVTMTPSVTANTNTAYKVEHYQMNTSGTYPSTASETQNLTGTTSTTLTLANLKKTYTGFTYSYGQVGSSTVTTTTIAGDGTRVIKLYYSRNKYTFTLGTHEGVDTTGSTPSGSYYYGATILLKGTLKTGYTGDITWTSSNTALVANKTTTSGNATTFGMPINSISFVPYAQMPPMIGQITGTNIGDPVIYESNGETDWKIFYKDNTYVYIILSDYAKYDGLSRTGTGLDERGDDQVAWKNAHDPKYENPGYVNFVFPRVDPKIVDDSSCLAAMSLLTPSNWSAYADGAEGACAVGAPSLELFLASVKLKYPNAYTSLWAWGNDVYFGTCYDDRSTIQYAPKIVDGLYDDKLYFPRTSDSTYGNYSQYLLATMHGNNGNTLWCVRSSGHLTFTSYYTESTEVKLFGLRPVIRLPQGIRSDKCRWKMGSSDTIETNLDKKTLNCWNN